MWFGKKNAPLPTGVLTTSEGLEFEVVTSYKYLREYLGTYQSCRLKLNLDLVSSIIIAPLSIQLQNNPDSDDNFTHARLRRRNL